eukprot:XP_015128536.2 transcriptional regulatory protein LGE1-like [Gallus gallus]
MWTPHKDPRPNNESPPPPWPQIGPPHKAPPPDKPRLAPGGGALTSPFGGVAKAEVGGAERSAAATGRAQRYMRCAPPGRHGRSRSGAGRGAQRVAGLRGGGELRGPPGNSTARWEPRGSGAAVPPPAAGPPPRLEQELGARLRRLGDAFQQAHELQPPRPHGGTFWGHVFQVVSQLLGVLYNLHAAALPPRQHQ